MNVLLLDDEECLLPFGLRCMRFGHHVRLAPAYNKGKERRKAGDGLIEKIEREEWQKSAKWADLIVLADSAKWLRELDSMKKKGYPVLAPSVASAELELDRKKGQALFEKAGINVMPFEGFSDFKKAEKYVRENLLRYVSKPNANQARELSYVSQHPADMVYMLQRWGRSGEVKGEFMLQEFVKGCEIAVSGWLGPNGFCKFFEENVEHKPLMNDNKYVNTGETGTVIKYTDDSALANELLMPLERELVRLGHTGSVDVSVILDENGELRPLEFTCRLGWPAFNICQALHPEPCEWMVDLIDGTDSFRPTTDHAVGVVVFQSPFPFDDFITLCGGKITDEVEGVPLYHLNKDNEHFELISPCSVMEGIAPAPTGNDGMEIEDDKRLMVSCGDYLAVCTGTGPTVRKAKDMAYKVIDSLEIPNSVGYRTDIGDRLGKELSIIQGHGFLDSWSY